MAGPLSGLKVIEMAGLGPAPFCAMLLASGLMPVFAVLRPRNKQFFELLVVQRTAAAQLAGSEHDFRVVFNGFHAEISLAEVRAVGDYAVIGHQDGIVFRDERSQRVAEFLRPRGGIRSERYRAKSNDDL